MTCFPSSNPYYRFYRHTISIGQLHGTYVIVAKKKNLFFQNHIKIFVFIVDKLFTTITP
jgi:hypothetical protein